MVYPTITKHGAVYADIKLRQPDTDLVLFGSLWKYCDHQIILCNKFSLETDI